MQSFKVVDENEACDVRHLEIVSTFGSAPRNAEIINFFGEDILPFITYKESKFPFCLSLRIHPKPCLIENIVSCDSSVTIPYKPTFVTLVNYDVIMSGADYTLPIVNYFQCVVAQVASDIVHSH